MVPQLIVIAILTLLVSGCDQFDVTVDETVGPELPALPETFATPEDALARVQQVETAQDRLALLDLMFGTSMSHKRTVELTRDRWLARLDFADALAEAFGEDAGGHAFDDLGAERFRTDVADAGPVTVEGRRAIASYVTEDEQDLAVVFLRVRGGWVLSTDTLAGGVKIDDFWFARWQSWFHGRIRVYRRLIESVRAGDFDTVDEAIAALNEALDGPLPIVGGLSMFGALPQRTEQAEPAPADETAEDATEESDG